MYKLYSLMSRLMLYSGILFVLIIPGLSFAETFNLEMVPPVDGVAHISSPGVLTPDVIMNVPLSGDQKLGNLLDNNPNTFYQPFGRIKCSHNWQ